MTLEQIKNDYIKDKYLASHDLDTWIDFQNFFANRHPEWFEENYIEGWQLDKDILVKGNKIYSPETCCFVPSCINNLFIKSNKIRGEFPIGVSKRKDKYISQIQKSKKVKYIGMFETLLEAFDAYKVEKEKHIKNIADEYKDYLNPKVYEALYKYKVEITD